MDSIDYLTQALSHLKSFLKLMPILTLVLFVRIKISFWIDGEKFILEMMLHCLNAKKVFNKVHELTANLFVKK